jgi:hypothetical protein
MIGGIVDNAKSPVALFKEKQPAHLMGECHVRNSHTDLRPPAHFIREAT